MSTSSNKQQKKGKDGMGNAGKRKEMVKDRRPISIDKCHACHAECTSMSPSDKCHACHAK